MQKRGRKLKQTFTIGNAGRQPLNIYTVQAFGHSATVKLSTRKLVPGAKAKLTVTIDRERLAKQKAQPRILLITDDPQQQKKILICKMKD